jgi:hypothetical protein
MTEALWDAFAFAGIITISIFALGTVLGWWQ